MGFLQNNFGFVQNDWQKTTESENFAVYKCTIMISSPQRLIALETLGDSSTHLRRICFLPNKITFKFDCIVTRFWNFYKPPKAVF